VAWVFLLVSAAAVGLLVFLGFWIQVRATFRFLIGSQPEFSCQLHSRFFQWHRSWHPRREGEDSAREPDGRGAEPTDPRPPAESFGHGTQKGFIRMPDMRSLRRRFKDRLRRGLFRLASDPPFLLGILGLLASIPRRVSRRLHLRLHELILTSSNPATLGESLGWAYAVSGASGIGARIAGDFSRRESSLRGEVTAQLTLWGVITLLVSLGWAFPWRKTLHAFGLGFFTREFQGWRKWAFEGIRRLANRKRVPAASAS